MGSSGGVFSNTLQSITTTKLRELSNKRALFEDLKSLLLLEVQLEADQKARVRKLIEGVKQCFSVRSDRRGRTVIGSITDRQLEVKLKNLERFLQQAQHDPSISSKLLQDWELSLRQRLNVQTLKYQYATLYGELVTEWLSAEHTIPALPDNVSEESEVFEQAIRKEKLEQRTQWENDVFQTFETDEVVIESFLQNLFGKKVNEQAFKALEALRASVEAFEASLATPSQFNNTTLKWIIEGLLGSDLLSDEKRAVLKDFISNAVILSEVADVLNMRMTALQNWDWEGNVAIDQRRHLNGKYKVYMHEDVLQAIFLQFIGVKWSVFFKRAFRTFARSDGAWIPLRKPIPKLDRKRREYFLGSQPQTSVQTEREEIYMANYFMSKLLDFETQDVSVEDGNEECRFVLLDEDHRQAAPKMHKKKASNHFHREIQFDMDDSSGEDEEDVSLDFNIPTNTSKNPMEVKQRLLHLLSTEILINTELHGEFTCVRSEFHNWEQTLPHSTIALVLTFFGISNKWLDFFLKFLKAPLKFLHDDSTVQPQVRKRGVPESHVLSDVFGEAVLFCLDFSVNQVTGGGQLHRMHDEFWFWSSSHDICIKAWTAVQIFGKAMGMSLNEGKSGSERILRDREELPTIDPALPDGEIRWGFLVLDPESGRFTIDQSLVDIHIEELRHQLQDKTKSIFSWVLAWNTYAGTFFTTNFGKPANCYGQKHVDDVLASLERVQRSIFTNDGGIAEYLKIAIQERFGVSNTPDGYLYFPTDLGGLELHNTFIPLLQIRDAVFENPQEAVTQKFAEAELEAYRRAKTAFDNGRTPRKVHEDPNFEPEDKDTFMSFEEFTRYREEPGCHYSGDLHDVFVALLQQPTEESVEMSPPDLVALKAFGPASGGIGRWHTMTPYWRWVVQLYGPDMIERFGGLNIVDRGLLPIGMVNLFRSGRVKWQG
jgi:hypothetical protein